jgi:peptide/nickel transport system substrate-binding protein
VEWQVIPDSATAVAALLNGEVDWLQNAATDLLDRLRTARRGVDIRSLDPGGAISVMRFNHLFPPFDNPAVRRAVLSAIDQTEFMTAAMGEDRSFWYVPCGVFSPKTPMASDAGIEALTGPRDTARAKRLLAEAGYKGERVVMLGATDYPVTNALALVGADLLRRIGMNVDFQSVDWGTTIQRRASRKPLAEGGWSIFYANISGVNNFDPAGHLGLRANGDGAWFGWPKSDPIEALRAAWLEAPDLQERQRICAEIQLQAFQDVPFIPLGCQYQPSASRGLTGMRRGFIQFYDVRRA